MLSLTLACPAKINLFLRVVGRRPDGYHNLVTIFQPLDLADTLTLALEGKGIRLTCSAPGLPVDDRNLAVRAARLFQEHLGQPLGLHITLVKRIPVAAGLGGGSSNAAGVLRGLNQLCGHPLSPTALARLAASLGADVPFFLLTGPALGTGTGATLRPLTLPPYWYVLLNPGYPVGTAWVYKNLRLPSPLPSESEVIAEVYEALQSQPTDLAWLVNDLEAVTLAQHPDLVAWQTAFRDQGAMAALMSGSGPTIFGVFRDGHQAHQAVASLNAPPHLWITITPGLPDQKSYPLLRRRTHG